MILFKKAHDVVEYLARVKKTGGKIGFIPTMGALHGGHISLIQASKKENDLTVCSLFINPTQFNNPEDFRKYPVTLDQDICMLEKSGCDLLFHPAVAEVYPDGLQSLVRYDLGYLETVLEGKFRPGHYQGVCQIVSRLLDIVNPDLLYLGQKDYQQCMVIARLIELKGKKDEIRIRICPTLRERDGLAMSSRNLRLNEEERKKAVEIYQTLMYLKNNFGNGTGTGVINQARSMLEANGFKIDYVEIADAESLLPVKERNLSIKSIALIAAFLNDIRLIDNMILN